MAEYLSIENEVLRWAIARSGLPLEAYAPAVSEWVSGQKSPTFRQLEEFSRKAMVPLGYLFLKRPPEESLPLPDYRTRTDEGVRAPSPNLIETVFEMQRRQDWMREFLTSVGQSELSFVGSAKEGDEASKLARRIRDELGLEDSWAENHKDWESALRFLRQKIENAGILIFINGIVGNSTHRKLDPDEFQGFVLIDPFAPLIFVNGADYKVAQMFTIAHELVHVWLGQSALFDLHATEPADFQVERYCNAVAAELLVPENLFLKVWPSSANRVAAISELSRRLKVSSIVIARRAKDLGLISADEFFAFFHRRMQREFAAQEKKKSGGDFWLTQDNRLGKRFGRAVVTAVEDGRISYTTAYDLTRLRGETFDKYVRKLRNEEHP